MMATKDPFSIKIALRHPAYSPKKISEGLSLKPEGSWAVGQKIVKAPAKWTFFSRVFAKGQSYLQVCACVEERRLVSRKELGFLG